LINDCGVPNRFQLAAAPSSLTISSCAAVGSTTAVRVSMAGSPSWISSILPTPALSGGSTSASIADAATKKPYRRRSLRLAARRE
jgi:hypothetical protein